MREESFKGTATKALPFQDSESKQPYIYALWSALAFATMSALSHLAAERCDWRYVTAARTSLAFLFALALALSAGVRLVYIRPRALWLRSLAGSASLLCAFYALTHMPVSAVLTLSSTVPVWVTILAWPMLGQRPGASVWTAVAAGFAGVALIQRPELSGEGLAALLALTGAVGTAFAMIGLNKLGSIDARAVVVHFSAVSTIFALVFLFATAGRDALDAFPRDAATLTLLLCVGLSGTVGQIFMTRAFAAGAPARVSIVGLSQIVFALIFDAVIWRRSFDLSTFAGIFLVVAPSAWLMLNNPLRKKAEIHTTS